MLFLPAAWLTANSSLCVNLAFEIWLLLGVNVATTKEKRCLKSTVCALHVAVRKMVESMSIKSTALLYNSVPVRFSYTATGTSLLRTFAPWSENFHSLELSFPGTFAPKNESSKGKVLYRNFIFS